MMAQDSMTTASSLAVRQACDELSRRLRAGLSGGAEELLAADPTIESDIDAVLELIYTEFVVREQLGQQPQVQEWLDRFPKWRRELEQLFEVHAVVENAPDYWCALAFLLHDARARAEVFTDALLVVP
jgi:hypothetical protein